MAGKSKIVEQMSARREVEQLFSLAKDAEQKLADRYVFLARKIASKNRISLKSHNREHCRKCSCYFNSSTLRVRMRPKSIVYACLRCGDITRLRK